MLRNPTDEFRNWTSEIQKRQLLDVVDPFYFRLVIQQFFFRRSDYSRISKAQAPDFDAVIGNSCLPVRKSPAQHLLSMSFISLSTAQ